jgi:DNA-directed RNA polymerase subunit M/transcription elongation factor TFIIS
MSPSIKHENLEANPEIPQNTVALYNDDIKIEPDEIAVQETDFSENFETGVRKYQCNFCNHICLTKCAISYHIESRHFGIRYECSECVEKFTTKYSVIDHITRLHENVDNVTFAKVTVDHNEMRKTPPEVKCDICSKKFSRKWELKLHVSADHENKRVKCAECGKLFNHQVGLKRHYKKFHENKEVQFESVIIDTSIKEEEESLKKFECKICDMKYFREYQLSKHIEITHDGRRFQCTKCGVYYTIKRDSE